MAPLGGVVTMMLGALRSILFPAIGPAVAQFPATSQMVRLFVLALASSTPGETPVTREKSASAGLARPEAPSLAVHASVTLSPCHAPSGAAHDTVGAAVSGGGLIPFVPASTQY